MPATVVARNTEKANYIDLSGSGSGPFVPQSDNEPERATFGAFLSGIAPPATPTDWLYIQGSSKVIRLKSLILAGTATAASNVIVNIFRRTAAYTGGTTTAVTTLGHDSNDGSATAAVKYFTVLPTGLGAGVLMHGGRLNLAPAANGSIDRLAFQYSWQNDKAPILRGTSQFLAINFGGIAWPAGGAIDIDMTWTEE